MKKVIKKFAQSAVSRSLARRLSRARPIILMYHGITLSEEPQDWTQVPVERFDEQMRHLRRHYHPVSLDDLTAMLKSGDVIPHTVAVTFDDGYRSNLTPASSILEKYKIPATIFVASGFVEPAAGTVPMLWPDFITALLHSWPETTVDFIDLELGRYDISTPAALTAARETICGQLKTLPGDIKDACLAELHRQYDDLIDPDRFPDYLPLTPNDVRHLAGADLITIGAHTRSHPILSRLSREKIKEEIIGGKNDLERLLGRPVTQFAYPNGRWADINDDAVETAAEVFDCAVITEAGCNPVGQNKYLLRRVGIGCNLSMPEFRTQLSGLYYIMQAKITGIQSVDTQTGDSTQ